jgi:hypothetical protein
MSNEITRPEVFLHAQQFNLFYGFEPAIFDRLFSMTTAKSINKVKVFSKTRGVPLTLNVSRDVPAHCD